MKGEAVKKGNKWGQTLTISFVLVFALTGCGVGKKNKDQMPVSQSNSTEIASSVNKSLNGSVVEGLPEKRLPVKKH